MRPLIYVVLGMMLGLAAFALLVWILTAEDNRAVQQSTPAPPGYLQVSHP
ncbi:hypothetical protein [Nonomuraea bangladeshensis]